MKKSVDKVGVAWYYKQAPKRAATTKRTESFGARSLMRGCKTGETVNKKALCKLNNTKNKHNPEIYLRFEKVLFKQ